MSVLEAVAGTALGAAAIGRNDETSDLLYTFVQRATFGPTTEEYGLALMLGPAGYIEYHLNYKAIDDSPLAAILFGLLATVPIYLLASRLFRFDLSDVLLFFFNDATFTGRVGNVGPRLLPAFSYSIVGAAQQGRPTWRVDAYVLFGPHMRFLVQCQTQGADPSPFATGCAQILSSFRPTGAGVGAATTSQ